VHEYRSSVTVNGRSPSVSAGGPYSVDEGGTVTLAASGSDPDGDSITYAWDLDGNGSYETAGQSTTFHAGDGPATVTVGVQATDSTGATATSSATVTVRNVPPSATFHAPGSATVGVPFTISLSDVHDPSAADTFTYAFDCGDGSGYGPYGSATSASCVSVVGGPLTVRGAVKDNDGGVAEYTATVKVDVTFAAVCALAQQYGNATKVCEDLDRAAKFDAQGKRKQVEDALDAAAKDVGKSDFTPREQETLLALLAKL
jgi:hypothetical protein